MNRDLSPPDIVIGFGMGVAGALIGLRLAGIVDDGVSIWGQFLLIPTMLLFILRQLSVAPLGAKRIKTSQEHSDV